MFHRTTAFTLIEVLISVTLLAIAATIIGPRIGASQDWLVVPCATRQVLSDMLYLQNYAITTRQTVWVYVFSGNTGYTAATFSASATPTLPTYSQATDPAGGGFAGTFVPRPGLTITGQPGVSDRLITRFGPGSPSTQAPGALPQTLLQSVVLDTGSGSGTPIASFGFDYTGQPVGATSPLINNVKITVTSSAGSSPTPLYIHTVSGEITAGVP